MFQVGSNVFVESAPVARIYKDVSAGCFNEKGIPVLGRVHLYVEHEGQVAVSLVVGSLSEGDC